MNFGPPELSDKVEMGRLGASCTRARSHLEIAELDRAISLVKFEGLFRVNFVSLKGWVSNSRRLASLLNENLLVNWSGRAEN